jgi:hypothetical protein
MKLPQFTRNDILRYGIPGILGAAAGFAYYHYIGCASGTCPLTSNPWTSTAYGAAVGVLLVPRKRTHASTENISAPEQSKGDIQ